MGTVGLVFFCEENHSRKCIQYQKYSGGGEWGAEVQKRALSPQVSVLQRGLLTKRER